MHTTTNRRILFRALFCLIASSDATGQVVINEIDYDQPGTDTAEFVEIYNGGILSVDLSTYTLELVNGSGGGASIDESIPLTGSIAPFGYYVICQSTTTVPNCDQESISSFQNGAPDAVGLRDGTSALVDAVSYEGDTGAPYTEGSGTTAADNNTDDLVGLSRSPASLDTDNNDADFTLRCSTAGEANTLDSSNCDSLPVELGELRLQVIQHHVLVLWETLGEVNTIGFEVEEFADGQFMTRGFLEAHGAPSSYRFEIGSRAPGVYKFRIRILNTDGTSEYSSHVEAIIQSDVNLAVTDAFPNPFDTESEISVISGVGQQIRVTVYDILGRTRMTLLDQFLGAGETSTLRIGGHDMVSGLYFVRAEGKDVVITKSLVLSR